MDKIKLFFAGGIALTVIGLIGGIWYLRTRQVDDTPKPRSAERLSSTTTVQETEEASAPEDLGRRATSTPELDEQRKQVMERDREYLESLKATSTSATTLERPAGSTVESKDTDRDGLTDDQELQLGTDVNRTDSDGDSLSDYDEVVKYKTNPVNADSDGDGFKDGAEIQNGYNPLGPGKCLRDSCVP